MTGASTVDRAEVDKFDRLADEWWNPNGKFRPLHKFNPVRLAYIKETLCRHFARDPRAPRPLEGIRILDIGCGGGLVSEPLARLGGDVLGADAAATNVEVAKVHAARSGVEVAYRATTAEALAEEGETFDVVLALEIIEHVASVEAFAKACARMVRPGGLLVVATINRTPKAFLLAIVGAERILRWLPRGTHAYEKLVRPEEIDAALAGTGVTVVERHGVSYNPLRDAWGLSADTDVNYMVLAARGGG